MDIQIMKFRLIKDWYIDDFFEKTKIFENGHIFSPNENGEYHIIYGGWSEENKNVGGRMILNKDAMKSLNDNGELLFEQIVEKKSIEITINENPKEDNEIKRWRIQLDVNTTFNNLKKIETFLKENIDKLL
jgi:hypothetical protein